MGLFINGRGLRYVNILLFNYLFLIKKIKKNIIIIIILFFLLNRRFKAGKCALKM